MIVEDWESLSGGQRQANTTVVDGSDHAGPFWEIAQTVSPSFLSWPRRRSSRSVRSSVILGVG